MRDLNYLNLQKQRRLVIVECLGREKLGIVFQWVQLFSFTDEEVLKI